MAFIFKHEDGTGYTDANSYASVAQADEFFEIDIHEQTWPGLDETVKEKLLAYATRLLERRMVWKFEPASSTQALHWPVEEGKHPDNSPIEVDEIPEEIVEATILYARRLADAPPSDNASREGLEEVEVDVIRIRFHDDARVRRVPDEITQLVSAYGREKSAGPRYGKIRRA